MVGMKAGIGQEWGWSRRIRYDRERYRRKGKEREGRDRRGVYDRIGKYRIG